MEAGSVEDIQKHVRIYMVVFASLAVLTIATVAVSYLDVSVPVAVLIALILASIKGSLVACYFMHLISERRMIYAILIFSFLFLLVMILIPTFTDTGMLTSEDVS